MSLELTKFLEPSASHLRHYEVVEDGVGVWKLFPQALEYYDCFQISLLEDVEYTDIELVGSSLGVQLESFIEETHRFRQISLV